MSATTWLLKLYQINATTISLILVFEGRGFHHFSFRFLFRILLVLWLSMESKYISFQTKGELSGRTKL